MSAPEESLTALISAVRTRKILVYDLESKDGPTQKPGFTRVFLGGVYDGAKFSSFRNHSGIQSSEKNWASLAIEDGGCLDKLLRFVLTRDFRGHYIYAHNGGNFDHLHLLPWLTRRISEFSYVIIPIQSSIQVLRVTERSSKQTWTFLDSIRLLPMSLDKVAKTFGLPGKLTHDLSLDENDPAWKTYLRRDCEALYDSLTQFQSLLQDKMGGEMGITAPSTAMKLFRRRFMGKGKTPALIPQHRHFKECDGLQATPAPKSRRGHTGEAEPPPANGRKSVSHCEGCLHAWIRRGYYGGRVEVFRSELFQDREGNFVRGGRDLSYYDINSSYPRAMLEDMPGGVVKHYGPKKTVADFERLEKKAVGFVECQVTIPDTCYLPPLPYRHVKTGKLVFPTGTFSGVWSWSELKLLADPLVGGRINTITRSVWYERKSLFFDFVKELYAYRDKNDPNYEEGLAAIAKLMLNSEYGKFGMNEERREILVLRKDEQAPEGATFPRFEDGQEDVLSKVCYVDKRVFAPYIIPQISAQITALARVRLWNFMASVLRVGGTLYYCDTDSLITNLSGLPTSGELGMLKNEYPGETIDVELVGPKMYLLRKGTYFVGEHQESCEVATCPGCKKVKLAMKGLPREKRTELTLRQLQAGEKVYFKRLEKLGAMAGKGFLQPPAMREVFKRHMAQNDKREVLSDGNTKALHLSEDEIESKMYLNGVVYA